MRDTDFSRKLLHWFDRHGRKDLPWQTDTTPYRVWVSEIMLQQTQVSSVIPYYQRFMARFPDVRSLADAAADDVMHHWSGLGYYARARNLHRAAKIICSEHEGRFPESFAEVAALPGVGLSTAGAILALACGQRHAILDGNVKRVLARFYAVDGWSGRSEVAQRLWTLAERHTPQERVGDYTQAIMDLGATLCTRSRPRCTECPVKTDCLALAQDRVTELPSPKPRKALPVRVTGMLMLHTASGEVLLEQRPPVGIWGGLWSLPECDPEADPLQWCRERIGCEAEQPEHWKTVRHTFSHFHLDITPIAMRVKSCSGRIMEGDSYVWYNSLTPDRRGLAAPVVRLLNQLKKEQA